MAGGEGLLFKIMEEMLTGRDVRALLLTNKKMLLELKNNEEFNPRLKRIIASKIDTIIEERLPKLLEEARADNELEGCLRALGFYEDGNGQLSEEEERLSRMFEEDLKFFKIKKCSDSNSASRNKIGDMIYL